MQFKLAEAIEVLQSTPGTLRTFFQHLSDPWINNNEGPDTWSPYMVLAHLIYGEQTDWIPRTLIILDAEDKHFVPFDRFAHLGEKRSLPDLLDAFEQLRKENIGVLKSRQLGAADLDKTGIHPEFGEVTLRQLLAAWVAHDLGHIHQISRTMAYQYLEEVGPWPKYLAVYAKWS